MTLTEAALKKLTKEENIKLTFCLQYNFNQDLKLIKKYFSELRENFCKIEATFAVTKQVNNVLHNHLNLGVMSNTPDGNI